VVDFDCGVLHQASEPEQVGGSWDSLGSRRRSRHRVAIEFLGIFLAMKNTLVLSDLISLLPRPLYRDIICSCLSLTDQE
jgi:hypothetical protein